MNTITQQDQFIPGLQLPPTETFDDWRNLGRKLCMSARAVNWLSARHGSALPTRRWQSIRRTSSLAPLSTRC